MHTSCRFDLRLIQPNPRVEGCSVAETWRGVAWRGVDEALEWHTLSQRHCDKWRAAGRLQPARFELGRATPRHASPRLGRPNGPNPTQALSLYCLRTPRISLTFETDEGARGRILPAPSLASPLLAGPFKQPAARPHGSHSKTILTLK